MYETKKLGEFGLGDRVTIVKGDRVGESGSITELWTAGEYEMSVQMDGDPSDETWSFNRDEVAKR